MVINCYTLFKYIQYTVLNEKHLAILYFKKLVNIDINLFTYELQGGNKSLFVLAINFVDKI